ncbi:helix-turn-helix domain-containing protein [Nonomuraea indica]|uniref:helix-turn-helix domain-containing protein n=1 Tax=Nonomuraea indica TaxID=1581193 RepID=UPI000C7A9747|nr:XRE family transcriptional regulator [Nonomuraea indica]
MEPRQALGADPRAVGERLRRLRQSHGVSLAELARRAGIEEATLSGLEAGAEDLALETLWAITAQLGVPIGAVLDPPAPPRRRVRGSAVEMVLLQSFEDETVTYELYRLRVPPGPGRTAPGHDKGVSEHVTVFSGRLTAGPVDAPLTAGPGDHVSWGADVPHCYRTLGPEDVHACLLLRRPSLR